VINMQLVDELLNKYQTENPFKLAQYLGFEVVFRPLPEKIRSSFVRTGNVNYVVLNTKTSRTTQTANCITKLGQHLLFSHQRNVSYHTVEKSTSFKTDLSVFIMEMMKANGEYTEKTFVRVTTANGVPKHIAEFLLNTWKEYKQRESGLYVRE
jgi:hypothetical protein